jgi:ParB-like chromosome segregation protein Spo0J
MSKDRAGKMRLIPLADLIDGPWVRKAANDDLEGLQASLKDQGQLQNINVRPSPTYPGKFEIIAGRRRVAAARRNGTEREVWAMSTEMDDVAAEKKFLAENLYRKDDPADVREANTKRMYDLLGGKGRGRPAKSDNVSQLPSANEQLAKMRGKSVRTIQRYRAGKKSKPRLDDDERAANELISAFKKARHWAEAGVPDALKEDALAHARATVAALERPKVTTAEVSRALQTQGYKNEAANDTAAATVCGESPNAPLDVLTIKAIAWLVTPKAGGA